MLLTIIILFSLALLTNKKYPFELLFWNKYSSSRVPLSFSYPNNFPISECKEYLGEPLGYEEYIRFSSSCDNRSNDIAGAITVIKSEGNQELPTRGFLGIKLTYKKINFGNTEGYQLIDENQSQNQKNPVDVNKYYYIFSNGYQYQITITNKASFNNKLNIFIQSFRF